MRHEPLMDDEQLRKIREFENQLDRSDDHPEIMLAHCMRVLFFLCAIAIGWAIGRYS